MKKTENFLSLPLVVFCLALSCITALIAISETNAQTVDRPTISAEK